MPKRSERDLANTLDKIIDLSSIDNLIDAFDIDVYEIAHDLVNEMDSSRLMYTTEQLVGDDHD
jgi:hypothetical protein